jgi:hypothetical protein
VPYDIIVIVVEDGCGRSGLACLHCWSWWLLFTVALMLEVDCEASDGHNDLLVGKGCGTRLLHPST